MRVLGSGSGVSAAAAAAVAAAVAHLCWVQAQQLQRLTRGGH
jgi:hypothetical protein